MVRQLIKLCFLTFCVLPLAVSAEEERDLSFIDGIWQSYGQIPGPLHGGIMEPVNKFYSLHYDKESKTLLLIDLPTIDERNIPVLMASFIGKEEADQIYGNKHFALDMVSYDENIGASKEYPLHRLHVIFHTETEAEVIRWSPLIMLSDANWTMRKIFRDEPKDNSPGKSQDEELTSTTD